MRETLEQLKAIRDGAPDCGHGTCFIDSESIHWIVNCEGSWYYSLGKGHSWIDSDHPQDDIRSLSDIERQIELLELIDDIRALGFLEESHDSGVSHRKVCKRAKELLG